MHIGLFAKHAVVAPTMCNRFRLLYAWADADQTHFTAACIAAHVQNTHSQHHCIKLVGTIASLAPQCRQRGAATARHSQPVRYRVQTTAAW